MKKIAQFEKVSYQQFHNDYINIFNNSNTKEIYESILLPKRATKGSAGYDFFIPMDIIIHPKETITIPTGIRARITEGWVLKVYPRSGLGFKYRLQLNNTVGIIDSDYYNSSNQGHIMIKITNDTNENKMIMLSKGEGFAQGIFLEYGITFDDEVETIRDGGFGSTSKIK